jgi:hypothetical protein
VQQAALKAAVQHPPREAGLDLADWHWKVVRRFVSERFGIVEALEQPRALFAGHTPETPWTTLQLAYFVGTAIRRTQCPTRWLPPCWETTLRPSQWPVTAYFRTCMYEVLKDILGPEFWQGPDPDGLGVGRRTI